jgi:hypothetical protein
MYDTARAQEFAAIQNKIAQDQLNAQMVSKFNVGASLEQMKFEQAQRELAAHQQNIGLKAALESYQQQQLSQAQQVKMVGSTSQTGTSVTTQIRPLGCVPTKVPVYTEKDQPGVNEYAFCGEQNLRGSQTLKRTNLHHNYVHDVNHLHNYHNRIKHQARQFNTVVKDCSCIGETEQLQGCACEADP